MVVDARENSLAGKQTRTSTQNYTAKCGSQSRSQIGSSVPLSSSTAPIEHLTRSFLQVLSLVVSAGEATAGDGDRDPHMPVRADSAAAAAANRAAARQRVTYFCAHRHESEITFAVEAVIPESWDCPKCGLPASLDSDNPPPAPKNEPYKTHLAYVKERRTEEEAAQLLEDALQQLRQRRGTAK